MSNESLSALFDGECSEAELNRLLDELESSPELAQRWSRWQLRHEVQEGTRYRVGQPCICAGVMAGLEEPVKTGRVVDMAAWRRRIVALPWKPAVGLAAAASMGAAAVLMVRPDAGGVPGGASQQAGSGLIPTVEVGNPLNFSTRSRGQLQSVSLNGQPVGTTFADDEYAELLRDYLISHSNSMSDQGVSGTLRYARFAASYQQPTAEPAEGQR